MLCFLHPPQIYALFQISHKDPSPLQSSAHPGHVLAEKAGQAIQEVLDISRLDLGDQLTEVGPQVVHCGPAGVDVEEAANQTWTQKRSHGEIMHVTRDAV